MHTNPPPDFLNFANLPDWVQWLAQDANGTWWGYEAEPHQHHCGWYENEVGRSIRLGKRDANPEWEMSLREHQR